MDYTRNNIDELKRILTITSDKEMASYIGITVVQHYNLIAGRRNITPSMALLLDYIYEHGRLPEK